MRSRPALLALAWLGVTVGLTAVAWLAVRIVATQVGGSDSTVLTEAQVTGLLQEAPTSSPSSSTPSPSSTKPSASPRPTSTPSTSKGPSTSPDATQSANPGTPASSKSFATAGGVVSATCHGATISLGSARPADGWTVEVKDQGPDRVEVRFEDDGGNRTEVRVSCVHGDPVRDTNSGSGGGGSDD